MKTFVMISVVVCLAVGGVLMTSGECVQAADERPAGFSSGFSAGLTRFSDGDLGTGFGGRAFLEYAPYIHEIALRVSGGYLRFEDDVSVGSLGEKENLIFEDFYLTGGLIYRFSRGRWVPFVTANVGVYHYQKEDVSPAAGPVIDGVQTSPFDTVTSLEGNDVGFNVGGGIEWFLSRHSSLSLEILMHSIAGEVDSEIFDVSAMFRFFPGK